MNAKDKLIFQECLESLELSLTPVSPFKGIWVPGFKPSFGFSLKQLDKRQKCRKSSDLLSQRIILTVTRDKIFESYILTQQTSSEKQL